MIFQALILVALGTLSAFYALYWTFLHGATLIGFGMLVLEACFFAGALLLLTHTGE